MTNKRQRSGTQSLAPLAFLLPNALGFLVFTLFPVLFSFWMAFTNWTPKPAVPFAYVGLRNFSDLLGVRPLGDPNPLVAWGFTLAIGAVSGGSIALLWSNLASWRGTRAGGLLLLLLALALLYGGVFGTWGQGVALLGAILLLGSIAVLRREEPLTQLGWGLVPSLLLVGGAIGVFLLSPPMWRIYEPRDTRFWLYAYNTAYLMVGIPFSIGGSLLLALLLNEPFPTGDRRTKLLGAGLCFVGGIVSASILWSAGKADAGLIAGLFWLIAAVAIVTNVVAFRTLFYLPTFTAGVALMILWKALYNPQTGPINVGLLAVFHLLHLNIEPPQWLGSIEWAKPALILMGVWTGIGGTNMLLYLAGLSNVPRELLDAAEVDGAGAWARFRHVVWPQLAPTTFFITIMAIIGGLQGGFEQARVMTNGGPAGSTTTLGFYIYNKAFQDLDLGYAAAISWVLFAVVFIATALNWKFGKGVEVDG